MASEARAPESDNLSMDRKKLQIMKGPLNEGLCDVTGRAMDLYHDHSKSIGAPSIDLRK
jgi:hypothetical protein